MKLFHLSDIHIGKRVNGFSMLEDQKYILQQILEIADQELPDGVLLAGDLYDKSMPSAEAVELADWFLTEWAKRNMAVWLVAGNHDSAERVAYGANMLEKAGIYVSRVFDGSLQSYPASEQVTIYLMPYLRPAMLRRFYPDQEISSTEDAVRTVLEHTALDIGKVNILVMHQFMAGASVCDSEEVMVGGLDQVNASLVEQFDYVALGHLHGPQKVGKETIRYSGSPLKYSFSEINQKKSITVVEIGTEKEPSQAAQKPAIKVRTIPIKARRDLREIRGPIASLLKPEVYGTTNTEDYMHITLTDEGGVLDAIGRLREVYPNIMRLDFATAGSQLANNERDIEIEEKTAEELFADFFLLQTDREMTDEQAKIVQEILREHSTAEK